MWTTASTTLDYIPEPIRAFVARRGAEVVGLGWNHVGSGILVGRRSELQSCGVRSGAQFARSARGDCRRSHHAIARAVFHVFLAPPILWGWRLPTTRRFERLTARLMLWLGCSLCSAGLAAMLPSI